MFNISKIRPKSLFGPVKAQKFSRCLRGYIDLLDTSVIVFVNNLLWYVFHFMLLSGEPDYFGRNKISSGGDLSHYSSASLY